MAAYVPALYVALLLMLSDVFFTSIRSTFRGGGDVATYVLLSMHEVVAVCEGVIIFAFFSYTVWFSAGLLGHLTFTVRATLPLWILRLFFIQMPTIYGKFLAKGTRMWDDPVYGVLFCLDIVSCAAMCVGLMFTVSCLSEKRMYAPYHLDWRSADTEATAAAVAAAVSRRSKPAHKQASPLSGREQAGFRSGPTLLDVGSVFPTTSVSQSLPS